MAVIPFRLLLWHFALCLVVLVFSWPNGKALDYGLIVRCVPPWLVKNTIFRPACLSVGHIALDMDNIRTKVVGLGELLQFVLEVVSLRIVLSPGDFGSSTSLAKTTSSAYSA
jgi:hypothetical protein